MPSWFNRPLELGHSGPDVELVQRRLKMHPTGTFDQETEARVRAVQKSHGLPLSGVVDGDTAEIIGESERHGLLPEWYTRPLWYGMSGDDVQQLRFLLGFPRAGLFDRDVDAALRRFQSRQRITPTGVVDEDVATLLGEDVPLQMA